MNLLITGHRKHKLENYDCEWIKDAITMVLMEAQTEYGFIRGYVGMASGVDLWFCESCRYLNIPYVACIPFEEQDKTMSKDDAEKRNELIKQSVEIKNVKNSWMVEQAQQGIVVWDGNKGGTHNVLQQLIENKKSFWWINPVSRRVWRLK